ncbi:MAG: CoA activase [Deltaproteobacteria bacterium]|nr:CoA activase [Deltaproteobacteria bacterium]MBW1976767.1 CoA activase [Deltaproteobacteria bacterium]MBW2043630.1 CoA activase [Deltaproteobacteria bacterium]MBW2300448.1 CoA activase [Deltaproteobacteria bacterium]
MEAETRQTFQSLSQKVGRFRVRDKIFLIPEMNRIGCHLLAGTFRGFGVNAVVMKTYAGLDLGKEFTSGKECFPCQVTTGDILLFMKKEKERLGERFDPENYIYFMPEADGPCRFGMYNKYQRIVLDSFPELEKLKIGALTSKNSYSLEGMFDKEQSRQFRKVAYLSVVVADVLDRLLWRIRPYERKPGEADQFIERAMAKMSDAFETLGPEGDFDGILEKLEEIVTEGKSIIDPSIPRKPLIGVVGEIYLRTHVHANQDIIRVLEKYGAEVVNASIAEWVNYTTYDRMREAKIGVRLSLKQLRINEMKKYLKKILGYGVDLSYQQLKQKKVYKRVKTLIELPEDHRLAHLEKILKEDNIYSFDVGTEACLSISGMIEYAREGYNGVVNVYPFTCMPSTITSSIVKPIMNRMKVPYLDAPYDGSYQPGREAAIRTFMYQAQQHFRRNGRKDLKAR